MKKPFRKIVVEGQAYSYVVKNQEYGKRVRIFKDKRFMVCVYLHWIAVTPAMLAEIISKDVKVKLPAGIYNHTPGCYRAKY